jgi:hypothetical protein
MTWSVYQHWDPLRVCVVGRSYPPEFYSWITVPHVRSLFEKIAIETEEDYQGIIKKLQSFGVEVHRPRLPKKTFVNGKFVPPPMTPRDHVVMVGETFYENLSSNISRFYQDVKDPSWPDCRSLDQFYCLPDRIKTELLEIHDLEIGTNYCYQHIFDQIANQGNKIKSHVHDLVNGANVSRIGRDLYFGTACYEQDTTDFEVRIAQEFPHTRNHIIDTGGHSDAVYCPVCPGLIVSLYDVPTYADTFPGWEVVYLPGQSWDMIKEFRQLKKANRGKWWIPGFETDQDVIDVVEQWLTHWTGYVEETVFDVNMLIVDPKNVLVFSYNQQVFDALSRYGITAHVTPFRHRYFWDGGIHCVTTDLHREGAMNDYFPQRARP